MGTGNNLPPNLNTEIMRRWYEKTPKWKLAKMLLQFAPMQTGENFNAAAELMRNESTNPYYTNLFKKD